LKFEERKYRSIQNELRFDYFNVVHQATDLWIGLEKNVVNEQIKKQILDDILVLRNELDTFIALHPEFNSTLIPLQYSNPPKPIQQLLDAAEIANTGPMAGIAGLFSKYIGMKLIDYTRGSEVLVENGGDIFSSTKSAIVISVYAGQSPLSNKIALNIPAGEWGICTSSGTVGHSTSFGNADAVTVVSKSTVLADALATQIANQVKSPDDIQGVIEDSTKYKGIEGVVIICGDKMGVTGALEIVPAKIYS